MADRVRGRMALGIGVAAVLALACQAAPPASPSPGTIASPTATAAPTGSATAPPTVDPSPSPVRTAPPEHTADLVIVGANVITMDDARPRAEAIAIRGGSILAVGSNAEIQALRGPATPVIQLDGLTVTPGFIDTHQHRIGDGPSRLGLSPADLIDAAIAQGLTTIHELYVDEHRLNELSELDEQGLLRLRVNAYLPVNENSPAGTLFDDYYSAYAPGQLVSPHVRVAGLKVFTDFDNAQILLWRQADLNDFLLARHREGWPLAMKTVSTRSLAMILEAIEHAAAEDPTVVQGRPRLEHMLFATPDQIDAMGRLGIVPAINLNLPGSALGVADIEELVAREPDGAYVPWRSLFAADIPVAGISGFPSLYVDVPTGAPFGSPLMLMYQATTRASDLGEPPPSDLLDQAMTAEQAVRALTITAAYAAFEEDAKGRLAPGMLADLVVLSADPLAVAADEINDIAVLLTMVGGRIEHCASDALCPPTGAAE